MGLSGTSVDVLIEKSSSLFNCVFVLKITSWLKNAPPCS